MNATQFVQDVRSIRTAMEAVSGEEILRHLGRMCDLEEFQAGGRPDGCGIVAGQAVASAVQDLYFGGRGGVYNDVDYFTMKGGFAARVHEAGKGMISCVRRGDLEGFSEYGQLAVGLLPGSRYCVTETAREGFLNTITVGSEAREAIAFGRRLLEGFDLNCVQVGVDVWTGRVLWTQNFEKFLMSRQMEITSAHTPAHTAIRVLRKNAELSDVYVDIDRVMRVLAGAQLVQRTRELFAGAPSEEVVDAQAQALMDCADASRYRLAGNGTGYCQRLFGPGYAEKARGVEQDLAPWFRLSKAGKSKRISTLVPLIVPEEAFLVTALNHNPIAYAAIADALLGHHKPAKRERLMALWGVAAVKKRGRVGADGVSHAQIPFWPVAEGVGIEELMEKDVPTREIESASRIMFEHPGIIRIVRHGRSLTEQCAFIRSMQTESKKRGRWVDGFFDSYGATVAADPSVMKGLSLEDIRGRMQKLLDEEEERMNVVIAPRRLRKDSYDGILVRELVTRSMLVDEGERLHHCVGGYGGLVDHGGYGVVSLRGTLDDPATWSTALFKYDRDGVRMDLLQHFGVCNSPAPEGNSAAIEQIRTELLEAMVMERYPWAARLAPPAWVVLFERKRMGLIRRVMRSRARDAKAFNVPGEIPF